MRVSALIGLSAEPPYMPECRSRSGPFSVTCTYTSPRRRVVMAGVSMSHMPVSEITATSAASSRRLAIRNGSRLGLPTSSSPSSSTVTRAGRLPVTACQARNAASQVDTCPLSSTAPRATTRLPRGPSTTVGSNGGLGHSSSGSGGCTS